MAEQFDPYHTWLGIPPEEQPPNCYRLLGIRVFEDRPEVIEHAADQRMAHLKSLAAGPHAPRAQRLLNEVAAARIRLLDAYKKSMYDERLRQAGAVGQAPPPAGTLAGKQPVPPGGTLADKQPVPPGEAPTATYAALGDLGEYRLIEKLGEGGMGAVYKALHTKLNRIVALKLLSTKRLSDPHAVARFEREMKAVGAVDHPNVVRPMDARQIEGTPFLVMEHVDGVNLSELWRRCQPISLADACEIIRQAALGLEAVRHHGLVHRDVKPSNVMVTAEGVVKLLDLGLARFQVHAETDEEVTGAGVAMGTADYMAPEQISDSRSADIRADIYALGCTLYKLLTGQAPFSGPKYQTMAQKVAGHLQHRVPPIRQLRGDVPAELARLLDRMLAKDPAKRPNTPAEVADAVGPVATTSDLPALVARCRGQVPARPDEAAGAIQETRSSSSVTRFFEKLVGRRPAAGRSGTRSVVGQRKAPTTIAAIAVLAAVALGAVVVWGVLSLRGAPEAVLRFDWPDAERKGLALVIDGEEVRLPASGVWEHRCPPGEHRVSATRPGYRMPEQVIEAQQGQTRRVAANWQRLPNLVLEWPQAERAGAMVEIDGKPCEIEPLALRSSPGQVQMVLEPGPHQVRLDRLGYEPIHRRIEIVEGRQEVIRPEWREVGQPVPPAAPGGTLAAKQPVPPGGTLAAKQPVPPAEGGTAVPPYVAKPKPIEEDPAVKRRRELAARWAEAAGEAEKLTAAWDFQGARKALENVRFEEPELSERVARRRDELARMAALKIKLIQRINAAQPRLKKSDLGLRGLGGEVVKADEEGITAKLISDKTETLAWSEWGEKAVPKLLQYAVDTDKADDCVAAGLVALSLGDSASAERSFDQARVLGTNIEPYLVPLAESLFSRAEGLLQAKQFAQAERALGDLEAKYSQLPWFAANKPTLAAAREAAKTGIVKNQEAENLYAEAARLFAKKELFDVKALVEKLKSDYPDTDVVRRAGRRPSVLEMQKAVAGVPKAITVRLDGKGDFKGIQAAIDASPSKSVIEIEDDGPYKEKVLIPKDKYEIRLRGKKGYWPVITSAEMPAGERALVRVEGSGAFLERLVLLHDSPVYLSACLAVAAGDCRGRWAIVHAPGTGRGINTADYQRKSEWEECLVTTGAYLAAPAAFRNCLFLGSAEAGHLWYVRGSAIDAHFCTILPRLHYHEGTCRPRDSIFGSVNEPIPMENCVLMAGNLPEQRRGCFKADPMFVDPKDFDYRLKPGSPCIGKASDGGDIGCRYTPEMIELCKQALELRRKGILKF